MSTFAGSQRSAPVYPGLRRWFAGGCVASYGQLRRQRSRPALPGTSRTTYWVTRSVFAPVSAAVSLGASGIMRCQRALQLITGVALGIVLGSGVQAVMGEGPVALGVAVFVSMCLAAVIGRDFVGAGAMFINQTASSAVLVIALHRTGTGSERLIDALIGGGVALTMAVLLFPAAHCH